MSVKKLTPLHSLEKLPNISSPIGSGRIATKSPPKFVSCKNPDHVSRCLDEINESFYEKEIEINEKLKELEFFERVEKDDYIFQKFNHKELGRFHNGNVFPGSPLKHKKNNLERNNKQYQGKKLEMMMKIFNEEIIIKNEGEIFSK